LRRCLRRHREEIDPRKNESGKENRSHEFNHPESRFRSVLLISSLARSPQTFEQADRREVPEWAEIYVQQRGKGTALKRTADRGISLGGRHCCRGQRDGGWLSSFTGRWQYGAVKPMGRCSFGQSVPARELLPRFFLKSLPDHMQMANIMSLLIFASDFATGDYAMSFNSSGPAVGLETNVTPASTSLWDSLTSPEVTITRVDGHCDRTFATRPRPSMLPGISMSV